MILTLREKINLIYASTESIGKVIDSSYIALRSCAGCMREIWSSITRVGGQGIDTIGLRSAATVRPRSVATVWPGSAVAVEPRKI